MLSIRKMNPMARAIGTMGVVAGLVGAVTFAQVPSNVVALQNNTLDAATASLVINNTNTASCAGGSSTGVSGMSFTNLVPGTTSATFPFCIENTGGSNGTPLTLSAVIPDNLSASTLSPSSVTLNFVCGDDGAADGGTVSFSSTIAAMNGVPVPFGTLNNSTSNVDTCTVSASLASGSVASGATVTPFAIDFSGTAGS